MGSRFLSTAFQRGFTAAFARRNRAFERRLEDPDRAQAALLHDLIRRLARTEYGRSYGVHGGESYQGFSRKLPCVTYEEIRPWIDRQAGSRQPVLTPEPVQIFEQTSGSSGPKKLIPYTRSLLASFDRLFFLWVYDLVAHGPELQTGKTFISISPAVRDERRTPSGVPIGFEDDLQYLSGPMRWMFGSRFLVPPGIGQVRDFSEYRRILAARLIAERDLEVISIWSPTYLTSLLDWASANRERLLGDLERGGIEVDGRAFSLPRRPDARSLLEGRRPVEWRRVWPGLRLLSCWTDGGAAFFVNRLRREFPGVMIQGKGLLATEAPITLPLIRAPAPVPLLDEVFLEFESDGGQVLRLHELAEGAQYEVIVSQKGGLSRYRMNDHVVVTGRHRGTPCLRFVGRARKVSDLVGEKLHERFVRRTIRRVLGHRVPAEAAFAFLVPVRRLRTGCYYVCVTDYGGSADGSLGPALETELQKAFQYRHARSLGQLAPVRAVVRSDARDRYYRHFMARGMKWGEIKYETLIGPVDEAELADLIG